MDFFQLENFSDFIFNDFLMIIFIFYLVLKLINIIIYILSYNIKKTPNPIKINPKINPFPF